MPVPAIVRLCTAIRPCQQVGSLSAVSSQPVGHKGEGGWSQENWEGEQKTEQLFKGKN